MSPAGVVMWLTGMPASGKTTLARALMARLRAMGRATLWLDSDALRKVMTPSPTYTEEERALMYATLGQVAVWAAEGGVFVVVSATAPRRHYRDEVRRRCERFGEIFVQCGESERRHRDPKALYRKSDRGEISGLPGVGVPYEAPAAPEFVVNTEQTEPDVLVDQIWSWLGDVGWLEQSSDQADSAP